MDAIIDWVERGIMTEPMADQPARRRAGRPVKAVLLPDRITEAALALINSDGYKGLTMSALAQRLKVAPSALYNHVRSKQDVLSLVQDHLMSHIDVSQFQDKSWDDAVRAWARAYRDVFAAHTPLIPIIAVQPVTDSPQTLRIYEAAAQGFRNDGWLEQDIVDAIVVLESYIYGAAFDVNAPEEIFDCGSLAPEAPFFSTAVQAREDLFGRYNAERAFVMGLDAIIVGLKSREAST